MSDDEVDEAEDIEPDDSEPDEDDPSRPRMSLFVMTLIVALAAGLISIARTVQQVYWP